jgi:hypothetical protein
LEGVLKETVSTCSQYHPGIYVEQLRKTMKYLKIISVPAKIRTESYR